MTGFRITHNIINNANQLCRNYDRRLTLIHTHTHKGFGGGGVLELMEKFGKQKTKNISHDSCHHDNTIGRRDTVFDDRSGMETLLKPLTNSYSL